MSDNKSTDTNFLKKTILGGVILIVIVYLAAPYKNSGASSVPKNPDNPAATQAITTYLYENFGMPGYDQPWYKNFIEVSIRYDTVTVKTNLPSREKAANVCMAVSGFVFSSENASYGLNNIQVLGNGGQILILRRGIAEKCY